MKKLNQENQTKSSLLKRSIIISITGSFNTFSIIQSSCYHRFLFDLCTHKTVLSTVESLLDSRDIVLLSSTIFTKYPPDNTTPEYAGDFVGWHQDLKYWGLESLDPGQQVPIVNMWLAIDKVKKISKVNFRFFLWVHILRLMKKMGQ